MKRTRANILDESTAHNNLERHSKRVAVLKVSGYLDLVTAEALDQAIESATKSRCYDIVIDLTDAEYIASMGWSIFLNHIKKLRENDGDLKLANMSDGVYEVYKVLEFFWFLKAYRTIDEAISAFDEKVEPLIDSETLTQGS